MSYVFLIVWLLFPVTSAGIAASRNRHPAPWFLLGLVLGPLGFVVALLPRGQRPPPHPHCDACPCEGCGVRPDAAQAPFEEPRRMQDRAQGRA